MFSPLLGKAWFLERVKAKLKIMDKFEKLAAGLEAVAAAIKEQDFVLQSEIRQFYPETEDALSLERIFVAKNPKKYPLIVVLNSDTGVSVLNAATRGVLLAPMPKLLTDTPTLSSVLDGVRSTFKVKG